MKRISLKAMSVFLATNMLFQLLSPTVAYALSGGPSQPEVESFEPVATTDMVDLFTGDFNYNIPLLDVGGYPINIAYHSGVSMDQEASWAGLGWNVNVGAINRTIRGVPDDFNGDVIEEQNNYFPQETYSVFTNISTEIFGLNDKNNMKTLSFGKSTGPKPQDSTSKPNVNKKPSFNMGLGVTYNNYRGLGISYKLGAAASSEKRNNRLIMGVGGGSQSGIDIDISYSSTNEDKKRKNTVGIGMNSKYGMRAIVSTQKEKITGRIKKGWLRRATDHGNFGFNTMLQSGAPESQVSTEESVQNYSIKVGFSSTATFKNGSLVGSYRYEGLQDGSKSSPKKAYGYMYAQLSNDENALKDFGKEREGNVSPETQNLPLTYNAFDIISASGQGTAGLFRPYRDNIGTHYDVKSTHETRHWGVVGAEVGIGSSIEVGLNYTPTIGDRESSKWESNNKAGGYNFGYFIDTSNLLTESFYFKVSGELTPTNKEKYDLLGNDGAVMQNYENRELTSDLVNKPNSSKEEIAGVLNETYASSQRAVRAQYLTYYNAQDAAKKMGIMPKLKSYFPGAFSTSDTIYQNINRLSQTAAKEHHIGEIVQTNPDGARYFYSIPAYNNTLVEARFNSGGITDATRGLITYNTGENSRNNEAGVDNFYNKTITPGYAHSYLLTAVLSPNYVDADADGIPSDGDLGDYVVFNYTRVHENYRWRVPIEENKGQFQDGLRSEPLDNMASFTYGTKEVWYLNSIISRNYIAEFKTSKRLDALGVKGENGGMDPTQFVNKLDSIYLFSKMDRIKNGQNAIPIKTAVFEYDYSLCPKVPNHTNYNAPFENGKLTLKKVYFLHGKSMKGGETPYYFNYGYNPSYSLANYDRWGNYKPNTSNVNNMDFPYVNQDISRDSNNAYAMAWTLNKIVLPSGGNITINYEADDYAYVQDRKAMQMVKLVAATNKEGLSSFHPNGKSILYDRSTNKMYDYLVFKVPQGISTAAELKDRCFANIEHLYFKALVSIRGKEEYASGWCGIDKNEIGLILGEPTYAYVKVKPSVEENASNNQHPISLVAFQLALAKMNKILYPGSEPKHSNASAFQALGNSFIEIIDIFRSPYKKLKSLNVARTFTPELSWIRIENANGFKVGGGVRVKKVEYSDGWKDMDETASEMIYDQEFTYLLEEGGRSISSGVAAYEPLIGGEENPFRKPKFHSVNRDLIKAELSLYTEEPYGETFFPGAQVGYSKITVTANKSRTKSKNGTGYTVNQFYTAKDFPVRLNETSIDMNQIGYDPATSKLLSLLKYVSYKSLSASQGYSIVVNDMHGKPKSIEVFGAKNGDVGPKISSVKYVYKTDYKGKIDNNVKVLNENGSIETKMVGKEVDCSVFSNSNESYDVQVSLAANLKYTAPVLVIGFVWPGFKFDYENSRYATVTKLIQEYGILEKTIVEDENSIISTSNLLYDKYTGSVILTQTSNNFNDPIYNFNYPAYLAYENMGPAYKNQDVVFNLTADVAGVSSQSYKEGIFVVGDELHLIPADNSASIRGWVYKIEPSQDTINHEKITVINHQGLSIYGNYKARVIQSGRKNMLNASVGSLVTSATPILVNQLTIPTDEVIQASTLTYNDKWPMSELGRTQTLTLNCNRTTQPFIIDLFDHLNYFLSQNIENVDSTIYWLEQLPGYSNSSLYNRLNQVFNNSQYASLCRLMIRNSLTSRDSSSGQTFYSNWEDLNNDTVEIYIANPLTSNNIFQNYFFLNSTEGCKLTELDRFLRPYLDSNNHCSNLKIDAVLKNGDTCNFEAYGSAAIFDVCFSIDVDCDTTYSCLYTTNEVFNPFVSGDKNLWLPESQKVFNEDRVYLFGGDTTFIRKDGKIKNFVPHWSFLPDSKLQATTDKRWVASNVITRYNKRLQPVEQYDALNNYASEIYGYNESFVTAASNYAKLSDLGSDNFEEYDVITPGCQSETHWSFKGGTRYFLTQNVLTPIENDGWNLTSPALTNKFSHTGTQSLCIPAKQSLSVKRFSDSTVIDNGLPSMTTLHIETSVSKKQTLFSPQNGAKYVVSAWVKGRAVNEYAINTFDSAYIRVIADGSGNTQLLNIAFKASGPIINGWQRIEGVFEVPLGTKFVSVFMENISLYRAYFDDVRIHPFASNMKTFVYHPVHLKVMAILDENNFATFYEYDSEGKLIRIKKETEKGIFTIKESRSGLQKSLIQ